MTSQTTLHPEPASGDVSKVRIREAMAEMRARTHALVAPLEDADLVKVHEPTMGPVNWDLAHVPYFEQLWLVEGLKGKEARDAFYDATFDAEAQPRPTRDQLDLPDRVPAFAFMENVRARVLAALDRVDLASDDPLLRDGFVYDMILQHEAQHQETMLITASLVPDARYVPAIRRAKPASRTPVSGMVRVPGGPFVMGADRAPGVYDNEGPAHEVDVPAFEIDAAPVTNGEYLRFIEDGGYAREDVWSEDGFDMVAVNGWAHPKHWSRNDAGAWFVREFDRVLPLPLDQPVMHVSWFEAEAYATWAGKRLPTEAEWEKAAAWDPETGTTRRFPWGDAPWTPARANLDQRLFGPAPVGAYPDGASAVGCHQMLGDVWEWTATDFTAYPGFEAFPYDEYSTPFFDRGFKVLRGGCWATRPHVARCTFRNWHQPDHQQVFAGFRCARDAEAA